MDREKNFEKKFRDAFSQVHTEDELKAHTKNWLASADK